MFRLRIQLEGITIKTLITTASLIAVLFISGCGQETANPYGENGWSDSEDFENVATTNPVGDELSATRLELFNKEIFIFVLMLDNTNLLGVCDDSELGDNGQGLTSYEAVVLFTTYAQDEFINEYEVDAKLLVRKDKQTGGERTVGLFGMMGAQPLPDSAVQDFSTASRLDVSVHDICSTDVRALRHFNVSGNLGDMLKTLEQRKADTQNAAAEKEFE